MTNTITIDSSVYADAFDYAERHNLSIDHLVEDFLKDLVKREQNLKNLEKGEQTPTGKPCEHYYVSPKIKPLLEGFKCDESLPTDYKHDPQRYGKYL